MAVGNNLYVVVHTASDYVSSEQLEKEFVSSLILGDVMNCVYIFKVEAIHGPLFVFKNYGSSGDNATKLFCTLPQRRWGQYTLVTRYNHKIICWWYILTFVLTLKYYLTLSPPLEIFPNRAPLFEIFFCAPVLNILICLIFLKIVDGKMPYPQLICWKVVLTPQICLNVSSVKGYVYIDS